MVGAELEGVDGSRIDLAEPVADQRMQTAGAHSLGVLPAEVEVVEDGDEVDVAGGDLIEDALEIAGEAVVDELGEMLLEHGGDGERGPARNERGALLPDVAAVLDRLDDGGVGGGSAHPELLELGHDRGLRVASRWLGGMTLGGELGGVDGVALAHGRQSALGVVTLVLVAHVVGLHPAPLGDDGSGGGELGVAAGGGDGTQTHGDGLAGGVDHLAGHRAAPDEFVEARLARHHLVAHLLGRPEPVAGGTDGLMGLLGVGRLLAEGAGRRGDRVGAEPLGGLGPGRGDGGARQRGGVGAHVGDVALLIQALGHRHDLLGRDLEHATGDHLQ